MLLRKIAKSRSEREFKENVSALKKSSFWLASPKLKNYFRNTWLTEAKASIL